MPWVVDTCLVIDVLDDDPDYGRASALLLDSKASDGLVLCPVSYVVRARAFADHRSLMTPNVFTASPSTRRKCFSSSGPTSTGNPK